MAIQPGTLLLYAVSRLPPASGPAPSAPLGAAPGRRHKFCHPSFHRVPLPRKTSGVFSAESQQCLCCAPELLAPHRRSVKRQALQNVPAAREGTGPFYRPTGTVGGLPGWVVLPERLVPYLEPTQARPGPQNKTGGFQGGGGLAAGALCAQGRSDGAPPERRFGYFSAAGKVPRGRGAKRPFIKPSANPYSERNAILQRQPASVGNFLTNGRPLCSVGRSGCAARIPRYL